MTLTGMKKHVGVLEQAGLVTTEKVGRVRTCKLGRRRLEQEGAWIERYRLLLDERLVEFEKDVPPALGRTLRRIGQGRRGTETEGEGRWTQAERVSPTP